ncbi:MAG TPA: thioredoxin domain-containing protein [Rhizomicrobium sp.]|nr:thioredoxin domain-containing protein [Rhizomicrobium sp.]
MSRKAIIGIVLVVVLAALGIGFFMMRDQGGGVSGPDGSKNVGFTLVATDRTMGNPKAPVTLIEYGAPTCNICAYFAANEFPLLKRDYIDTGKIFYVFRTFPLRPMDGDVEKMARCLPEDKYFAFIDLMWRNQPKWDAAEYPGITDPHGQMIQQARVFGMSAEQAEQCIANKAEDERINKVSLEAQQKYNLTGTPTFVVDGIPQSSGAVPYEQLAKVLDAAIAKKK